MNPTIIFNNALIITGTHKLQHPLRRQGEPGVYQVRSWQLFRGRQIQQPKSGGRYKLPCPSEKDSKDFKTAGDEERGREQEREWSTCLESAVFGRNICRWPEESCQSVRDWATPGVMDFNIQANTAKTLSYSFSNHFIAHYIYTANKSVRNAKQKTSIYCKIVHPEMKIQHHLRTLLSFQNSIFLLWNIKIYYERQFFSLQWDHVLFSFQCFPKYLVWRSKEMIKEWSIIPLISILSFQEYIYIYMSFFAYLIYIYINCVIENCVIEKLPLFIFGFYSISENGLIKHINTMCMNKIFSENSENLLNVILITR